MAENIKRHWSLYISISVIFCINFIRCNSSNMQFHHSSEIVNRVFSVERKTWEKGKEIWLDPNIGANGRSCVSCHPGGELTNAETYPRYKHVLKTMATLSMTNNFAVVNESRGQAWELGSDDANAIALFVTSLANGKKINMAFPQILKKEWVESGKNIFNNSELSENGKTCESCHQSKHRRYKSASAGHVNINLRGIAATYPKYREHQNRVITLEQQINFCIETNMKGANLSLDDPDIVALCCYVTSLSEGKKVRVAQFNK